MTRCVNEMRRRGDQFIPRTCPDCGLGPCKYNEPLPIPAPVPFNPPLSFGAVPNRLHGAAILEGCAI